MRNISANCYAAVAVVTAALLAGLALSERLVHRTVAASTDAVEPIPVTIAHVAMSDVASAITAQLVPAAEIQPSLPWGKPLSIGGWNG